MRFEVTLLKKKVPRLIKKILRKVPHGSKYVSARDLSSYTASELICNLICIEYDYARVL